MASADVRGPIPVTAGLGTRRPPMAPVELALDAAARIERVNYLREQADEIRSGEVQLQETLAKRNGLLGVLHGLESGAATSVSSLLPWLGAAVLLAGACAFVLHGLGAGPASTIGTLGLFVGAGVLGALHRRVRQSLRACTTRGEVKGLELEVERLRARLVQLRAEGGSLSDLVEAQAALIESAPLPLAPCCSQESPPEARLQERQWPAAESA